MDNLELNSDSQSAASFQTGLKTLIIPHNRNTFFAAFSEASKLHFIGIIKIRVLYGNIKVMGRTISEDGNFHRIYSPNTHPIVIYHAQRNSKSLRENKYKSLEEFLFTSRTENNFMMTKQILEKILVDISQFDLNWATLIEIKSLPNIFTSLPLSRFRSLFIAPRLPETLTNFYQLQSQKSKLLDDHTKTWEQIMDIPKLHMKTVICGPKNAGKSAFALHAINYLLESHKQVIYFECDPGQPEFLPNGVLGFHVLKYETFGPAYTHKFQPQQAYLFGSNTPLFNPERYIFIIRSLWLEVLNKYFNLPVIVNTCGWINGLGINLLADIFSITRPNCIIALHTDISQNWVNELSSVFMEPMRYFTKDIASPLKLTTFHNTDNLNASNLYSEEHCHIFRIKSFLSDITKKDISLSPSDFRCLNLVSYFIPQIHPISFSLVSQGKNYYLKELLLKCPVYEIPMNNFNYQKIYQDFESSSILDVVNGNLIGLGVANSTDNALAVNAGSSELKFLPLSCTVSYMGLGIVRCISENLKRLYICTPISYSLLRNANTIMVGSPKLFDPLYCLKETSEGSLYISEKSKLLKKGNKIRKATRYLRHKTILKRRRSLLSLKFKHC